MLLSEQVVAVASFPPLKELAFCIYVCRSWGSAVYADTLWATVFRRQWLLAQPGTLSLEIPDGCWRDICRRFCNLNGRLTACCKFHPCPNEEQQAALQRMSSPVSRFLFGITHGYVPTSDGLFTYHARGATPIHYRHNVGSETYDCEKTEGLRLCGNWTWSPDRESWFSTDTCDITRGIFGSAGWQLVADNMQIVKFNLLEDRANRPGCICVGTIEPRGIHGL